MLAFNASKCLKPKRASGGICQRNYYQGNHFQASREKGYTKFSLRAPRIKCATGPQLKLLDDRKMSTTVSKPKSIPLLNPMKLGPNDCEGLIIPPISIPRTMPQFPRNVSETHPSVTKILQATMPAASRFVLDRWKASMIKKLGIQGFNQYQKDTFERGRALHALLANYLLGAGEPRPEEDLSKEVVSNLWKSIQSVVRENISNVRLVEHIITHSDMNYRGIVDCVACYKDELVVIDFKTADKHKNTIESLYDNPLQVTAYCGALNNDCNIPNNVIDRNICSGLIIVAYVDGSEASTYYLSAKEIANNYWVEWSKRLDQYVRLEEMQKQQSIIYPAKPKK